MALARGRQPSHVSGKECGALGLESASAPIVQLTRGLAANESQAEESTMLRSLRGLEGYRVSATDGEIGRVVNFLLDEQGWTVRYLVVETSFIEGRRVLISPISFGTADWSTRRFHVALTVDKVKNSPTIDTDKPVSRQHERTYHGYYGYPYYWGYSGLWGMGNYPGLLALDGRSASSGWNDDRNDEPSGDAHLRSAVELRGYQIQASDKAAGRVDDFIVDDETWEVRYLAIDTSNWWFGKKVLVAPAWAKQVSWADRKVYVDMSRRAIKESPEWDPNAAVNREYEARLYDYYGRPVYWASGEHGQAPRPVHASSHPQ